MKREIRCEKCSSTLLPMHPEDILAGFKRRIVTLKVQKPAKHGIETITTTSDGKQTREFEAMPSIVCDHCSTPIKDGENAKAVTWWNTHRENEPDDWEEDYRCQ